MKIEDLVLALELPVGSRVDQRVPKRLLLENGAPTAADKRRINEGIQELRWLAALKPTTIGVPEYRDDVREYLEIAVLRVTLRVGAKVARLVDLVHRAVPYPVLLLTEQTGHVDLSAAHKRWAQNEAGKVVLDEGYPRIAQMGADGFKNKDLDGFGLRKSASSAEQDFLRALALGRQPRGSLYALYQGWLDALLALQAARVTGSFTITASAERASDRREALGEYARLEGEIARLRTAAAKEKQLARQVEMNLELKRAQAALAAARVRL